MIHVEIQETLAFNDGNDLHVHGTGVWGNWWVSA